MNLFNSKIVPSAIDAVWERELPLLAGVQAKPMLVISLPFSAGSVEETTLLNMLKACGFGSDDVNIIQLRATESLPWPRTREAASPRYVMLLGVSATQLGIEANLPIGQPAEFAGSAFIITHALQSLTSNEAIRKALWTEVLKPFFKGG